MLKNDRFIIRNSSNDKTLGGGLIFDVNPLHHKRRTTKLINDLNILVAANLDKNKVKQLVSIELQKAAKPLMKKDLLKQLEISESEFEQVIQSDTNDFISISTDAGTILCDNSVFNKLKEATLDLISTYHKLNPLKNEGISTSDLINKLKIEVLYPHDVLNSIINNLLAEKHIKNANNTWALASHTARIDPKIVEHRKWLFDLYVNAGLNTPLIAEVEKKCLSRNMNKSMLKDLLMQLIEQKQLFQYKGDYFSNAVLDNARSKLKKTLTNKSNGINEKEFRELMDVSKRVAQVLIEIFIHEGFIRKQSFYLHLADNPRN